MAAAAFGLAAAGFSTGASAQAAFGSAAENTYRDCGAIAANVACDGSGAGQQIIAAPITGGVSSTSNTTLTLSGQSITKPNGTVVTAPNDGSFANSTVTFGGLDLPVISGETHAFGNERMNVNAFGYQTYTYTGAADSPFSITGNLHIDAASGPNGFPDDNSDPANPHLSGVFAGGAVGTGYVGIWDTSILSSFTDAQSIFDNLFLAQCDVANPHVLAVGMINQTVTGPTSISATTSACAGGGDLILHPGDTILVVAGIQLPVNRGGFVDATHTFTTALGADLAPEVTTNLQASLDSGKSILGVPEPATWAMMLTGFFGLGAALRRRRVALAV